MIVAVVAAFCLAACTESVDNAEKIDRLPQIYPDYIGVTIPADIAPMDFNVEETGCVKVDVVAKGSKQGEIHTQGEWAEWDIDKGHVTKPFLLPQRNPRKYDLDNFDSFNCPDFTKTKVDFDIRTARERIESGKREKVRIR